MADVGGFGVTNFGRTERPEQAAENTNPCRELVEVPGGDDYILRRLIDTCSDFCWKYVDSKITAHYYFEEAAKARSQACFCLCFTLAGLFRQ